MTIHFLSIEESTSDQMKIDIFEKSERVREYVEKENISKE